MKQRKILGVFIVIRHREMKRNYIMIVHIICCKETNLYIICFFDSDDWTLWSSSSGTMRNGTSLKRLIDAYRTHLSLIHMLLKPDCIHHLTHVR